MKIAVNLLNYTNQLAGNGTYAKRVLSYLQRLDERNEYILFFSNIDGIEKTFGINHPRFKIKKINLQNRYRRILYENLVFPNLLNREKFDIYFSPSLVIPPFLKVPKVICTIHDLTPFFIPKYSRLRTLYYKVMCRRAVKQADQIITVSQNSKKDIENLLNANKNQITVVYNFLDQYFINVINDLKLSQGVTRQSGDESGKLSSESQNGNSYLLFVGTIQPGKNMIRIIEAVKSYNQKTDQPFQLKIAGKKGWNDYEINHVIEENPFVEILGYVSDNELPVLYKNAFALLYPSLYEGFGIPPLESITAGTPVIVSDNSSLPEVTGECGIYVNALDVSSIESGIREMVEKRNFYLKKIHENPPVFDGEKEVLKLLHCFEDSF